MLVSRLMLPTLRENPAEAEVISHQLTVRAGLIRKAAAGIYSYLPLGWRVVTKIMNIIREEMNRAGGQEVMLPIVQPAELWQESGRWQVYGDEMFRLKDRHQRDFCLGPTHEEIITDLVRREVSSYKQLPLLLYQVQNKYRDEIRPRFGLMRAREFIMKDMYTFDRDEEGLQISYNKMYEAYKRIFTRCGLEYRAVEADPGAIGGNINHEFLVMAQTGEAEIVYCEQCEYAANVEKAEAAPEKAEKEEQLDMQMVYTPGAKTIDALAEFLKESRKKLIKALFFRADRDLICVLVRGDRELNEVKLKNLLGCLELEMAGEDLVRQHTGGRLGYVGPVGLEGVKIYADQEIPHLYNAVCGANKEDYHYINVNPGRDFKIDVVADLRQVEEGEICPCCKGVLKKKRGIEVGHLFQLGTKYSEALGAKYTDENGKERLIVMGCYGIGAGRTMAAAVEQCHDDKGIIWPMSIAPYHVVVVPVSNKDEHLMACAERIYQELQAAGVEVVLDDRDERAGVKFADADLVGYPLRVTVGNKTLQEKTVDIKERSSGKEYTVELDETVEYIVNIVQSRLKESRNL